MILNSAHDWLFEPASDAASIRLEGRIETRNVLRAMIAKEIESGRLTPRRRKRIVQFASQLGLSPIEAGDLVQQCRLNSDEVANVHRPSSPNLRGIPRYELGFSQAESDQPFGYFWKQRAYLAIVAGCAMILLFLFVLHSSM